MRPVLLDGEWRPAVSSGSFRAVDPASGADLPDEYPVSAFDDLEEALHAAARLVDLHPSIEPERLAAFLEAFAARDRSPPRGARGDRQPRDGAAGGAAAALGRAAAHGRPAAAGVPRPAATVPGAGRRSTPGATSAPCTVPSAARWSSSARTTSPWPSTRWAAVTSPPRSRPATRSSPRPTPATPERPASSPRQRSRRSSSVELPRALVQLVYHCRDPMTGCASPPTRSPAAVAFTGSRASGLALKAGGRPGGHARLPGDVERQPGGHPPRRARGAGRRAGPRSLRLLHRRRRPALHQARSGPRSSGTTAASGSSPPSAELLRSAASGCSARRGHSPQAGSSTARTCRRPEPRSRPAGAALPGSGLPLRQHPASRHGRAFLERPRRPPDRGIRERHPVRLRRRDPGELEGRRPGARGQA